MAYEKSTWNTNDIISKEKLNNIENGIETLSSTTEDFKTILGLTNNSNDLYVNGEYTTICNVNSTKTDNNTSDPKSRRFRITDINKKVIGQFYAYVESDGKIGSYMDVSNYNTDGSTSARSWFGIKASKDGTITYDIKHPAALKSALGLGSTDMNAYIVAGTGTNSLFGFGGIVTNSANTDFYTTDVSGNPVRRLSFMINNRGIRLWDTTNSPQSDQIWEINPITDSIIIENKSFTISVPANDIETKSVDVSKTGYDAIGISGWQINSTRALTTVYITRTSAQQFNVRLRNVTSENANSISCVLTIIYMKK